MSEENINSNISLKQIEEQIAEEALAKGIEAELTRLDQSNLNKEDKELNLKEDKIKKEEITKSESNKEERTYSDLELEQMDKGWDPNKPNGVSAEEFKRVGEIIEAKRKASKLVKVKDKEIDELTKSVKQLIDDNRNIKKAAYEQAIRDLQSQKLEKIREGDVDAVLALENEINEKNKTNVFKEETVQQPLPPIPEEIKAFEEKHKEWLDPNNTDPIAEAKRAMVQSRVAFYQATNPNIDPKIAIEDVEDRLSKLDAKFEAAKPKIAKVAVSSVGGTSAATSLYALPKEEVAQYLLIKKIDPSYTEKEHLESLRLLGRIPK